MKTKSKKALSTLLVLALVFSLIMAMPIAASASSASEIADQINTFAHGGEGELNATLDGNTVTVTGKVTGVPKNPLELKIGPEVTVVWKAEYSGSPSSYLINLSGNNNSGTFEVAEGGSLICESTIGYALSTNGSTNIAHIVVSGGTLKAQGTHVINGGQTVTVNGGLVEQYGGGVAVNSSGTITINGGKVLSSGSACIRGAGSMIINGGEIINTGTGVALGSSGNGASITINGGTIESQDRGQTITCDDITISGGTIRSTGATSAIILSHDLTMTGGTVSAVADHTIRSSGVNAYFNIMGGFVFAYGTDAVSTEVIYGGRAAVRNNADRTTVAGNAVACAWNSEARRREYDAGTSTDLSVYPSGASAVWDKVGNQSGITYKYGTNTGFFPIDIVTVVGAVTPPPAPQTVTATPTASTVYINGEAVAFDAYLIGGANYFKLRDLAYALNGTEKQFEVGYDNASKTVTITSGQAYTPTSSDMQPGDGKVKTVTPTPSLILLDGAELNLVVYNIGGANFFKLRDLMEVIDVYVGYDAPSKAVTLETDKGYAG
ncbi:MAG: carbohydrate-binding domain-containing protein [Oscillospiraceae bacterium]|nr:carbohydrate-binding domain-containing protein [Oscillospiraceae bacterium]